MALIACPICGKTVSDKAHTCVHCGYSFHEKQLKEPTIRIEMALPHIDTKEGNSKSANPPVLTVREVCNNVIRAAWPSGETPPSAYYSLRDSTVSGTLWNGGGGAIPAVIGVLGNSQNEITHAIVDVFSYDKRVGIAGFFVQYCGPMPEASAIKYIKIYERYDEKAQQIGVQYQEEQESPEAFVLEILKETRKGITTTWPESLHPMAYFTPIAVTLEHDPVLSWNSTESARRMKIYMLDEEGRKIQGRVSDWHMSPSLFTYDVKTKTAFFAITSYKGIISKNTKKKKYLLIEKG